MIRLSPLHSSVYLICNYSNLIWYDSLIPGSIVAATGSFDAGILSLVVGAWLASVVMFVLGRVIRY
ncbi:hypothetical protein JOY44_30460 (plasmid) [Phormidium sp. CLA17]|uniref:hypothetical protein n=1 Tax=Leptolyngbya sp. Cla-17 TaxID=2803751 RepID=UPI001492BAE9|nr:hypothetical protein [Leptolyngbya sp. Cla-17]MBM0745741.1 hypothetical protein [Leptolyngbya sp. Cla-17]